MALDEDEQVFLALLLEGCTNDLQNWLQKIGIGQEAIHGLHEQSGWTIVVHCHALLEAAFSQCLISHLRRSAIERVLTKLPMRTKVELLRSLVGNPPDSTDQQRIGARIGWAACHDFLGFVGSLSTLRNQCVHRVANIGRSINELVSDLPKADQDRLGPSAKEESIGDIGAAIIDKTLFGINLLFLWERSNQDLDDNVPEDVRQRVVIESVGNSLIALSEGFRH